MRTDVTDIARDLLGKILFTRQNGWITGGLITETEAYDGPWDKASHAYGNRRTARTEIMFQKGGRAYVYLCYGMHHLFNVVTGEKGVPQAVLIRSVRPLIGLEHMLYRRKSSEIKPSLSNGPGKLCQALGINISFNGKSLNGEEIWIEEAQAPEFHEIVSSARIGIDYAKEHVFLPYRFYWKNEPYISKP